MSLLWQPEQLFYIKYISGFSSKTGNLIKSFIKMLPQRDQDLNYPQRKAKNRGFSPKIWNCETFIKLHFNSLRPLESSGEFNQDKKNHWLKFLPASPHLPTGRKSPTDATFLQTTQKTPNSQKLLKMHQNSVLFEEDPKNLYIFQKIC